VAVVWAVQSSIGASLQGNELRLSNALRSSLVQSLAWVPVTLAVIYLAARYPLNRAHWKRRLPIHLTGALAVAYVANLLVVLGFWLLSGRFNGVAALLRSAAMWTAVRWHIALLIYAAIAASTQAVLYYRDMRQRELHLARVEGQLARARLQALNAQIRPHFLFNTLHTIGQLWRSGQREDAEQTLDRLGSLFHKVQHNTAETEVPLADELELVRDYLNIEQMRFRDRLRVSIATPPFADELLVPPLILQPLVENAVRHGVSRSASTGRIDVAAAVIAGQLVLTVSDDGPGFDGASSHTGSGTGLSNTRERLQQLYGNGAALEIERTNSTTVTRVRMPVHEV
jgi:two-component system LytT family sensor kinase